ncbi:MAG: hypothetical protein ACI4JJ_05140 [Huintestinicola sp.]
MAAGILIIITGIALCLLFFAAKSFSRRLTEEADKIKKVCRIFEASVLDVHTESIKNEKGREKNQPVIILQFRNEEKHSTIVHRYTLPFSGKYSRGDKVTLFYREAPDGDIAMLDKDNPFEKNSAALLKFRWAALVLGIINIVQGAVIAVTLSNMQM